MEHNSQEMNESLDHMNPRGCYSRYVVINIPAGQVTWVETLDSALAERSKKGGEIYDTYCCESELLNRVLDEARHWFYVEYRLAVFYEGSPTPRNTYARHKALLLRMADSMSVPYWVLYRRGPVGLRERPVKHGGFMM